jgi:FAD/FMN-containing dehydrogenase
MTRSRRQFLSDILAVTAAILGAGGADARDAWPGETEWQALRNEVGDRLIAVTNPVAPLRDHPTETLKSLSNPFFLEDQAGATQTTGWLDAWSAAVSPYAVAAESAGDIAAAVRFAREREVRLAVKGTGHDYLGRSNAANSLLVWTHRMRGITFHERFQTARETCPALTVEAGTRWLEAYQAATRHGVYVQGGGCTSVGAAGGFLQGSGFGSFSKRFGTGAAGVLELEVVTADGRIRVVHETRDPDLFWALRGGGGGTYGIVTRATLRCHPLPERIGLVSGTVKAASDDAWLALLRQLIVLYPARLDNPHWGEQIKIGEDNTLTVSMTFLDLTGEAAREAWKPLLDWLAGRPADFTTALEFRDMPFQSLWNPTYWAREDPSFIVFDPRPEVARSRYWWAGNKAEVSSFLRTYQSRWLPARLFGDPDRLARIFFEASRHWSFTLHFNKGLAGASEDARARTRKTCLHPAAFDAAALIIAASAEQHAWPGVPGHEPDQAAGRAAVKRVSAAMTILREATPDSGTYANEADWFEPDWQRAFWGDHYPRLLSIKRKYDPTNLFRVHHGVGSEG